MEATLAQALVSPQGRAVLAAADLESDPGSLAAATRLRRDFPVDLAAAALNQIQLRRRAVSKMGERAARLFFTPAGLEQATRRDVASWRAQRLITAGVETIYDLGCGIGTDALAFVDAGLKVICVERDPATAIFAQANLGSTTEVICADATHITIDHDAAVYLDPARRRGHERVWRTADIEPSWDVVVDLLHRHPGVAKLAPGISHSELPDGFVAEWVSHHGDVVECGLWSTAYLSNIDSGSDRCQLAATLMAKDQILRMVQAQTVQPELTAPRRYLIEPNGAAIRANLLAQLARSVSATRLAESIAYLTSDELHNSPWLQYFAISEVLPYDVSVLRSWCRQHDVGVVEIKKRGVECDPAQLRKKLKLHGTRSLTLVLTPTVAGVRVLVCQRCPAGHS